jgi:hypothetical protein
MTRRHVVVAAVVLGALAAAAGAAGKGRAEVRLTKPLPLAAAPGTTIRVHWSVQTIDERGRAGPFDAIGMFVRLLSRTGAATSEGVASAREHPDGRYSASVVVPEGGIGGVRLGLHASPSGLFPLANDPFRSPGGARCDVAAAQSTLTAFVRAYNRGDLRRLNRLFSRDAFRWYSALGPDRRLRGAKQNRDTLIPYFRRRHLQGDRLEVTSFRFNGYERERDVGHFEWEALRRANDIRDGSSVNVDAKGALDCTKPPVTIALLFVGGEI